MGRRDFHSDLFEDGQVSDDTDLDDEFRYGIGTDSGSESNDEG